MKNLKFLLLAVLFWIGTMSCNTGEKRQKTLNGFELSFVQDVKDGALAKEGDYVYFRYYVMHKDSLIFSSAMQTPVVKFKLPKLSKTEQKNSQPITEALHLMSKGDSAIVYQLLDDQMKKSINLPHINELAFHVMLIDIKNEADYKADMEAEQKVQEELRKAMMEQAAVIEQNARKTLDDYKAGKLDGSIITTPSGLKYLVHEAGTGPKAENGKKVSVNYYGMLKDGTRFDDSWSRGQPLSFPLGQNQVIKGWDEGIANLNEGAKATLFIPPHLGYGAEGSPPTIPGNSELVFYVELVKTN